MLEKTEAEQHQRGVVGEDLFCFICGQIVELGESLAAYEASKGVEIVANHEEQLQTALGRFADAGTGGFFLEDELSPAARQFVVFLQSLFFAVVIYRVLADPQTSGGLLVAVAPDAVGEVLSAFSKAGFAQVAVIGTMKSGAARVSVG